MLVLRSLPRPPVIKTAHASGCYLASPTRFRQCCPRKTNHLSRGPPALAPPGPDPCPARMQRGPPFCLTSASTVDPWAARGSTSWPRCCPRFWVPLPGASRPVEGNPRSSCSSATDPKRTLRLCSRASRGGHRASLLSPSWAVSCLPSPEVCLSQAAVFPSRSLPKYHFLGACPDPNFNC